MQASSPVKRAIDLLLRTRVLDKLQPAHKNIFILEDLQLNGRSVQCCPLVFFSLISESLRTLACNPAARLRGRRLTSKAQL